MRYSIVPRPDYDKKVKIGAESILLDSPAKGKTLSGQTVIAAAIPQKKGEAGDSLTVGRQAFRLLPASQKKAPGYRTVGFVSVGEGKLVALRQSNAPFWIVLVVLLLAALAVGLFFLTRERQVIPALNPLPPKDSSVVPIESDQTSKSDHEVGGGSMTLSYSFEAKLSLSTGKIAVVFQNPFASSHYGQLELVVVSGGQEVMIAQSGSIPPGTGLYEMTFNPNSAVLSPGSYEALYRIGFFDPETGERAVVQTELKNISLTVTE